MLRAHRLVRTASSIAILGLWLGLSACGGTVDGPAGVPCAGALDCPGGNACQQATCVAGSCGLQPRPAGSGHAWLVAPCQAVECDGQGGTRTVADDANLPGDGNACTRDACTAGTPANPPLAAGDPCAQDGGSRCDGAGRCVQCLAPADCPGADDECVTRTCTAGVCGATFAPAGTPLAAQVTGDCRVNACDGAGGAGSTPLDTDLPVDGLECTMDVCTAGVPSNPPVFAGSACTTAPGAGVCDGAGACVQCLSAAGCPGHVWPCAQPTCTAGRCGTAFAPPGTFADDLGAGDCNAILCDGAGNAVGQFYAADLPVDGNPCTLDLCTGGAASNPPAPAGTACAVSGGTVCDGAGACVECTSGAQCASLVCSGNACQAPSCADLVRNGAETDVDCGGPCQACADGRGCGAAADCTSRVCVQSRCAAASCADQVRNGRETDVDCGGSCAPCAPGRACLLDSDCQTGACPAGACAAPGVTAVTPAAGAADVVPGTVLTLTFGAPVSSASLTFQGAAGPCTGSVQLSADGFTTCLGIASRTVSGSGLVVVLKPALALTGPASYQVRITADLLSASYGPYQPFVHPGFTVAADGGCGASALVVSQVYPGGGVTGASWAADYVELHNRSASPISLTGLSLQVPWGTPWAVLPLAGTLPPGGYLLVQVGAAGASGAPLPAPDLTLAAPVALSATGGYVGLFSTTVPHPTSACPGAGLLDFVGYGTASGAPVSCKEGLAPAPAPADGGAALARPGSGCGDTESNAFDLASQLAVPRNRASAPIGCACSGVAVNESGLTVEMDWCVVQAPPSISVQAGATSPLVYGRVFEAGVTEPVGPSVVLGQLGYGPAGTDPRYAAGWRWVAASFSAQVGNDEEYQASFIAPAAGSYAYAYRFSPDAQRWTYCDTNGAGSNPGLVFEPFLLPPLTVTP